MYNLSRVTDYVNFMYVLRILYAVVVRCVGVVHCVGMGGLVRRISK